MLQVSPQNRRFLEVKSFDKFRQYRSLTLLIGRVNCPSYTLVSDRQQNQLHCGGS